MTATPLSWPAGWSRGERRRGPPDAGQDAASSSSEGSRPSGPVPGADDTRHEHLPRVHAHARFGGGDQPGAWVSVYEAPTLEEAHIVKGRLESEDIPVVLLRTGGLAAVHALPMAGEAVKVQVPRVLAERALEVLEGRRRPGPPRPAAPFAGPT